MGNKSKTTTSSGSHRRGPKSFDERVHLVAAAIRNQRGFFNLEDSPLATLPFVEAAAESYSNRSYAPGMALSHFLQQAMDEIISETSEDGLTTISRVLQGIQGGRTLTDIAEELALSREHVSRKYAKPGFKLVTHRFFKIGEQYQAEPGQQSIQI